MMDSVEINEFKFKLEELMTEAVQLRRKGVLPKITDQSSEILENLHITRQALDRLEEIMRIAGRMKAHAERQKAALEAVADDLWATNLSKIRQVPTFKDTIVGPREKYAEADLSTLNQRRAARQAEDLLSFVKEAYEFIRTTYFGLNGVRDDIKDVLRSVTNESRLER